MIAFGLADEIEDVPVKDEDEIEEEECFEIFRENWTIALAFLAMSTQWEKVVLPNGQVIRTRMIYEAIPTVLFCMPGLKRKDWSPIFAGLHAMEVEALKVYDELAARWRQENS
jgi:hypothetical protein